jgi:hypothetical protein
MRVPYSQVFQINPNGSVSPRGQVQIGGVTMGGPGVSFTVGVTMGGIDIASKAGHDLEIELAGDVTIIKGVY